MAGALTLARPERFHVSLWDQPADSAVPLELPARRMWPVGLFVGAMFAVFAGVEWTVFSTLTARAPRDVFDLMFFLFQAFWLLGWSVGVVILGALTFLLLFYGETARLENGRLVHVPRMGPLKTILEYDLSRIRNLRLESLGDDKAKIRFDYAAGSKGLGDAMPRADAQRLLDTLKGAVGSAGSRDDAPVAAPAREPLPPEPVVVAPPQPDAEQETSSWPPWLSSLVLIGANLIPLVGVLFLGWDLASIMVLFWAESAVVGFYTAIKMSIVGKLAAIVAVPFFIGHFGGFMAGHFLLIYAFFVRGAFATGQAPAAFEALRGLFVPIWPSLAALFISHGVSFYLNFLGRREYERTTMQTLMMAPYNRIVVMQLALIFGGWVIILLKSPVRALAILIVIKTGMDLAAHRKEHGTGMRKLETRT